MNFRFSIFAIVVAAFTAASFGQAVCLPAPRLLTMSPMGGQQGVTLDVTIGGDNLKGPRELLFAHEGISASPKVNEKGEAVPNVFEVTIADNCPAGIYEARLNTDLGVSTARIFSVGSLPEISVAATNRSLETAATIAVGAVANAAVASRAIDYYTVQAKKDQQIVIYCSAPGIESKLKPVLILADATGADLQVQRRGDPIQFTAAADATYVIKVHDLTYAGGPHYFYRLTVAQGDVSPPESIRNVHEFSWPPAELAESVAAKEQEPNNKHAQAEKISLPCDIAGAFFPAADVDVFEFTAKKGEQWWVEVASQRLGLNTDPSIVVQQVTTTDGKETYTDVAELNDIPSPMKISSNGYSYDGPPYNAGSSDILGKLEIPADGLYRLQMRDLFGGTRDAPGNIYRLIVRKAEPDFALACWSLHMNLRNGDRNALSKPMSLRPGSTMPIEVVVIRRDGFTGEIDLSMTDLPDGVTATGLKIPAGGSRGILLVTADETASAGWSNVRIVGQATINGQQVTRNLSLASMQWPVPDAAQQVPAPRLLQRVPVSVGSTEKAPLTIAAEDKVFEVAAGGKLTIPLKLTRRSEFSGKNISLKTFGAAFEKNAAFDVSLTADADEAVLDIAQLKVAPGDHTIAFYGSAVVKYAADPSNPKTKDIVDIVVSKPIKIRVTPAQVKK